MSSKFFPALLLLCALPCLNAAAQEYHDRDSLHRVLKEAKADTNKVWLYIQLGQQYETNDPDSALALYESALALSEKLNYMRGMISYYTNATYVYNVKGMYDTALVLNLKSVELAKKFGNPERLAACLGNVGASYNSLDQPEKAIEIYLQIIPLFEKLPISANRGVTYGNLCMLYNDIGQYEKGKKYGLEGRKVFAELKNDYGMATTLNNLAMAHMGLHEYNEAISVLKETEALARRTNNQFVLMSASLNLCNVNIDLGNFGVMKEYCDRALALAKQLNDHSSELIALRGLAMYHLYKNQPVEAEAYANQSLAIALDNHSWKQAGKTYGVLADIAMLRKDFVRQNIYAMKSDSIREMVLNETVAKNVQNIEAKYETEKKEQRIRDLQQESEIKDLSLARNKLANGVLIVSLIALVAIALLAQRFYRQKRKLLTKENQVQEARIAQLEVEKQMLAGEAVIKGQEEERGRLAKDLHDGLGGMLSGVKLSLANMKSSVVLDADNLLLFERSLDMLDHSITELRRVAHNMMPEVLVKFGLSEALRSYCDSLRSSQLFKVDYQSVGGTERLADKTEIFIFRIVQELLNNVVKHAQASHVLVQLARNESEVSITVEDNGIGFDTAKIPSALGAGLASVQSRVDYLKGKLDIQSTQGQGTSVYIAIPI